MEIFFINILVFKIKMIFYQLFSQKGLLLEEVKDYEIKALKKQIFISNLKALLG